MESDNCPAKELGSSPSDAQSNIACNEAFAGEGDQHASNDASNVPNPELEELDSFNLIEPPPLDWRSDSSSEAGSVEEMDDSTFSVPGRTLEEVLTLPLDTSDPAVSPGVNQERLEEKSLKDAVEQNLCTSEEVGEQITVVGEDKNVDEEEDEDVEKRSPDDEDHTRIQALLNRLQLIGESPLPENSTPDDPSPSFAASSNFKSSDPSLMTDVGVQPGASTQHQTSGLLFSDCHQRDLLGLLECTEVGAPQHLEAQAAYMGPRGDVDAVVSVSYNQEEGERFWDHFGNGRLRHRDDSIVSLTEEDDETPEPVWMKLGDEPPEKVSAAESSERNAEDHPAYKDVPGPCDPEDLLDGVIFGANYLGSTQMKSEKNPSTNARMTQAQEAVDRIKAPEGESQPMTEVDLFISTQRIKVLSADTQEAMMDHSLQMISYIADIGDIVVLMARRKPAGRKGREEDPATSSSGPQKKCCMICHVFTSDDAQVIAQAIGQAFGVAYQQFLQANGIKASELRPSEYSDYLGTQELYNGDLVHFSDSDNNREVTISKAPGEIMGVAVVESGWGSILPTVVVANLLHGGPAERSGALSIGDRIMSVNGTSLVGLPIATCQSIIRDLKNQDSVKLSIVHCPPVTMAIIKRPDPKFQLGFSVEDGIICSLMRGGIAERGGIRVGHRIIEINGQSVVATPHDKIIHILTNAIGEIHLKTMPASTYRLLTGQEQPIFL